MTIVVGRGNKRKVFDLPCGEIINTFAKSNPTDYKNALAEVCAMFNIR